MRLPRTPKSSTATSWLMVELRDSIRNSGHSRPGAATPVRKNVDAEGLGLAVVAQNRCDSLVDLFLLHALFLRRRSFPSGASRP
jgi:hypothetical protein